MYGRHVCIGVLLVVAGLIVGCDAGLLSSAPPASPADGAREPIVGLPCEGCEAIFDGLPTEIPSVARIAPEDEPGQPLRLEGTVRDEHGQPVSGTIVYAYHTNARGEYPRDEAQRGRDGYRHGKLRGWARTDAAGRYRFETIRPGAYPDGSDPEHIHMHILEPGRCTYYIGDVMFADDPLLTPERRERERTGARGGSGVIEPRRDESGRWLAQRDVTLGLRVPDYPPRE